MKKKIFFFLLIYFSNCFYKNFIIFEKKTKFTKDDISNIITIINNYNKFDL